MLFFQDRVHSEALQYIHRHQRGRLSQGVSITFFARLPVFGRWFNSGATLQGTGHHVATQHNRDKHLGVVKVPYVRLLLWRPPQGLRRSCEARIYRFLFFHFGTEKIEQDLISSLTDTDSFVVSLYTDSLDKELQAIKSTLDTSNYPTTSPLFTLERQKQLFSWKNESVSPILLFVALRSKCYAFLTEESLKDLIERTKLQKSSQLPLRLKDQGLRNKGVVSALNESLGVVPYLCSLLARSFISANFRKIESCGSIPHVKSVFKSCLSFLDNKSLQKSCYIHSVPYGLIGEDLLCSCMDWIVKINYKTNALDFSYSEGKVGRVV